RGVGIVDVVVVAEHVAAGVGAGIGGAVRVDAGLVGTAGIGGGGRIVVGAVDGDRQRGGVAAALSVGNRVAERVGERAADIERLHAAVGVVDVVAVAAVGVELERAVVAGQVGADGAGGGAELHRGDAERGVGIVDVVVVAEHVAAGVGAGIGGAVRVDAGLVGTAGIGGGGRIVVGAVDGDRQRGGVAAALSVGNRVAERVGERAADIERLHAAVGVVDVVAVAAVGVELERAVVAGQVGADGAGGGAELHRGDAERGVGIVDVVVVAEHVAAGVGAGTRGAVRVDAGLVGTAGIGCGGRIVVGAVDGDRQRGGVAAALSVGNRVAERVGERAADIERLHAAVGVVDVVAVAAVGVELERAVVAGQVGADGAGGGAELHRGDAERGVGIVDVVVVAEHVAAGVGAGIGGAVRVDAGLVGTAGIGGGGRIVVGAVDGDRQRGGVAAALSVGNRVAERVGERAADIERLHAAVGVVDVVAVAAVGVALGGAG